MSISLKEIANLVKNTAAATIFAEGSEKTALSVRSTLLSNLESFNFLSNDKGSFSIRDWVKNETDNPGCVFITSIADQHEVLKPLISCWVDIFASSVLSMSEDRNRRIWLIIDELPSLHKLKSLKKILAESRKYGGCIVLGYQSYSDIESIYGEKDSKVLADLTATKIFFRSNDEHNAKHASNQLGREEVKTANENLSMGAHMMRDAVSISSTEKIRELVLPTQILNLNNMFGFYRLHGDYPVASFKQLLFNSKDKVQTPGFIISTKADHLYMLEGNNEKPEQDSPVDEQHAPIFGEINIKDVPDYITQTSPDMPLFDTKSDQQVALNLSEQETQESAITDTNDSIMLRGPG